MEPGDLLKKAMKAVRDANVPPELQETAFKEAVAFLRDTEGGGGSDSRPARSGGEAAGAGARTKRSANNAGSTRKAAKSTADAELPPVEDEDAFFTRLAEESAIEEEKLREALHIKTGLVQVSPPSRKLGDSAAERARNVVALVAGARHGGLGETKVSSALVRAECERKGCYQQNNFAHKHLGPLNGFNAAGQDEIRVNTKWLGEFQAALRQVLGETEPDS